MLRSSPKIALYGIPFCKKSIVQKYKLITTTNNLLFEISKVSFNIDRLLIDINI